MTLSKWKNWNPAKVDPKNKIEEDAFEERAAIREFDGNQSQPDAEHDAHFEAMADLGAGSAHQVVDEFASRSLGANNNRGIADKTDGSCNRDGELDLESMTLEEILDYDPYLK